MDSLTAQIKTTAITPITCTKVGCENPAIIAKGYVGNTMLCSGCLNAKNTTPKPKGFLIKCSIQSCGAIVDEGRYTGKDEDFKCPDCITALKNTPKPVKNMRACSQCSEMAPVGNFKGKGVFKCYPCIQEDKPKK
jgi:hypothetical protein